MILPPTSPSRDRRFELATLKPLKPARAYEETTILTAARSKNRKELPPISAYTSTNRLLSDREVGQPRRWYVVLYTALFVGRRGCHIMWERFDPPGYRQVCRTNDSRSNRGQLEPLITAIMMTSVIESLDSIIYIYTYFVVRRVERWANMPLSLSWEVLQYLCACMAPWLG